VQVKGSVRTRDF